MASVFDIAEYILSETGYVSTMKLQKLAFYSQAYSLVAFGEPLFPDDFEAWVNGPVCPQLFQAHRGLFVIGEGDLRVESHPGEVAGKRAACVQHILSALGRLSGQQLSELTHAEKPWLDARNGCADGDRCSNIIPKQSIREYYGSSACTNIAFTSLSL